jgi:putative ABC transport system substrate-binding protein
LPPGTDPPAGDGRARKPGSGDPGALRDGADEAAGGATTNRRAFFSAVTGGLLTAPRAAETQPATKVPRVGYLSPISAGAPGHIVFRQSLKELGYVDGESIVFQERFADGYPSRLPALAAELIRQNVDVIVAASPPAIRAVKNATRTIPIVMITADDHVRSGYVASLARPGGNITGVTFLAVDLFAKQMELLKEVVPRLTRVAFLWDPTMPTTVQDLTDVRTAARALGLQLQVVEARGSGDFDSAFAAMATKRADALVIAGSPTFIQDRSRIVSLAAKYRLPAIYGFKEDVEAGGLMSYGPRQADSVRLAASYVDRILKGTKPGDLPVEQPTKFELLINMKATKALGLTIPPSQLARADQLIE